MPKPNHSKALLEAGLATFHQRGYHASGVQDVVSTAGVPKGSFYNHFESKDALGLAVLTHYWDQRAEARAILTNATLSGGERLKRYLGDFSYSEDGCLIGNFTAELTNIDAFRERLSELWERWTDMIAGCISDGQRDGSVRSDMPARDMASSVIALLEGAILATRVERSPRPLETAKRTILRLLST